MFSSSIEMLDKKPGDPGLEDCVADVEREMRLGLEALGAYDVEVRRQEVRWANRIELIVKFKRKVPRSEAEAILAAQHQRRLDSN